MTELLDELRRNDIRLWRDGDNLRFSAPPGTLTPELKSQIAAHKTALLAHFAGVNEAVSVEKIPAADRDARLPLSFAQERLWMLDRLEPGLTAYNVAHCWQITGPLDTDALDRALKEIERRHEILRTVFPTSEDGAAMQVIRPSGEFVMHRISAAPDSLRQLADEELAHSFNLAGGPLWRVTLAQLGENDHALLLTWHHIICDAWSSAIFARELTALHAAFRSGLPSPLQSLPLQFADCAVWQRKKFAVTAKDAQLAFWRGRLGGERAPIMLPADRLRPARQSHRGGLRTRALPDALAAGLKKLARAEGVTLFVATLAAFKVLLARLSGETDICIGTPIAQRPNADSEGLLGFFLNMLALRSDLSGDPDFREVLHRVRATTLSAFQNQDTPFEKIVEALHPARDLSHQPIFQIAFVLQPPGETAPAFDGAEVTALPPTVSTAKFDLTLFIEETPGGMNAMMEYNADQFDAATADRMLERLELLLGGIVENPATPITRLPVLSAVERALIVGEWSGGERPYPHTQTIAERFAGCMTRNPDAIAVTDGEVRLTYAELDARANRVAHFLQSRDVRAGDFVGLRAERSMAFVVRLLAIAKAAAAYVPLDDSEPPARIAAMKAACSLVLDAEPEADFSSAPVISEAAPDGPAYVLYTSGSTGVPKGVIVPHRGIMRLVVNNDYAPFRPDDVVAFASNVCFDAATFEIWGALLNGASLVITPRDVLLSSSALAAHLAKYEVTVLFLTTSLFNQLAHDAPAMFAGLRILIFGGEAADAESVRLVLAHGKPQRLVNGYGPTEATTFAICHRIESASGASIPIGRPIANTRVFLLDRIQQPVPIGVPGEIHIGGPGVALGYHGSPELTAEKFPDTCYGRLYRTGDLARWLPDGTIEYWGRIDQQVKLRGFRIELGEIESALRQHPQIRQAAVMTRGASGPAHSLAAYFVPEPGGRVETAGLREFLSQRLPAYMLPSAFISLTSLPLTPNGKLDTRNLPQPDDAAISDSAETLAPRDEAECKIAEIWSRVLGRSAPSVREDFFTVGGHSLLALKLLSEVRNSFGIEIPARRLFETPTIEGLAAFVAANTVQTETPKHFLVPIQKGCATQPPLFLVAGGWGGEIEFLVYGELSRQIDPAQPIWGLKARGAGSGETPHSNVTEMAADYLREVRKIQPHGPYLLAGECVGGICAYEMACQLEQAGEEVALLVLLDTVVPDEKHLQNYLADEERKHAAVAQQFSIGRRLRHHLAQMSPLPLGGKIGYIFNKAFRRKPSLPPTLQSSAEEHSRGQKDYPVTLLRHRLPSYRGTVTLVLDDESARSNGTLGWENIPVGSLQTRTLPGTHLTYIRENAAAAAAALRSLLRQTTPKIHDAITTA